MRKRRDQTDKLTNKKMSPEVYKLRRDVMAFVYEARKLVDLPRIDVRVTDNHKTILGVAQMRGNIIWITEDAVISRSVVFHEILHAVFGQEHVEGCPLMAPAIARNVPENVCNELFLKYAKQGKHQPARSA